MEDEKAEIFSDFRETPLWNEALPLEERLNYLIRELTLEEKIQCLTLRALEVKRLGMKPFIIGGELAHGVEARHDQEFNKGIPVKTTGFTQPIGLSATWDTELMEKIGVVVGTEARAIYNREENTGLSRWGPTIDMERDPRWGRTEEGYGEDPFLTGTLSSSFIKGIQGKDNFYLRCAATLKHFYGNNEEKERTHSSSSIDSRNKYEYYLEPFKRAICEGKAQGIMTSYNEINGIPAILNPELKKLVKDTWGLSGHVVCDMGDMGHTVTEHKYFDTDAKTLSHALKCGVDSFNDPEEKVIAAAREALEKGYITEEDINQALRNTFATKLRFGIYDKGNACPYSSVDMNQVNCREHQNICLEAAEKAIVLLKNDNNLLPLKKSLKEINKNTIAVIGPLANAWHMDWYSGLPYRKVTPLEGLKKEFEDANVTYSDGIDRVKIRIKDKYVGIKDDGTCYLTELTGAETFEHMDWGDNKHTLRAESANKYLCPDMETGCLRASRKEVFSWFVEEAFGFCNIENSYTELGKTDSYYTPKYILKSWKQAELCADDKGRLYFRDEDTKKVNAKKEDTKKEDIAVFSFLVVTDGIDEAVKIAETADAVIAVMGCHPIINCKEDVDREHINFPPMQRKLLESLKNVNTKVILVLVTNYPYLIDWEKDNLPAILMTASGSQELGSAIAKVIAGTCSPAGRLSMTWYLHNEQLPPIRDYDIIQGKRTYQYFDGKVLYPFGYGHTYTTFLYQNLKVKKEQNNINISFSVKNMGGTDSDEVVQLYVSQKNSRTKRPLKQLKGYQRIFIKAGEEKDLKFLLPCEELKYYDVITGTMILEDGNYSIQIGASSQDIRLEALLHVDGKVIPPRDMSRWTPCDHYDGYENIILHRGHDNKPCILPVMKGKVFYKDAGFHFVPSHFLMDIKAEERGNVLLRFGGKEIITMRVEPSEDFHIIEMPITSEAIEIGVKQTLQMEVLGRIRIVAFSFR